MREKLEQKADFCTKLAKSDIDLHRILQDRQWHEVLMHKGKYMIRSVKANDATGEIPSTPCPFQSGCVSSPVEDFPYSPLTHSYDIKKDHTSSSGIPNCICYLIEKGKVFELTKEYSASVLSISTEATKKMKESDADFKEDDRMYIRKATRKSDNIKPNQYANQLAITETIERNSRLFNVAIVIYRPEITASSVLFRQSQHISDSSLEINVTGDNLFFYHKVCQWIEENIRIKKEDLVQALFPKRGIGWTCHVYCFRTRSQRLQDDLSAYEEALDSFEKFSEFSECDIIRHMTGHVIKIFKHPVGTEESGHYILKQYQAAELVHVAAGVPIFSSYTSFVDSSAHKDKSMFTFFSVQEEIPVGRFVNELIEGTSRESKDVIQKEMEGNDVKAVQKILGQFYDAIETFRNFQRNFSDQRVRLGFDSNWRNAALDQSQTLRIIDFSPPQLEYNGELSHCHNLLNGVDDNKSWAKITESLYEPLCQLCYIIAKVFMDAGDAEAYMDEYDIPKTDNYKHLSAFSLFLKKPLTDCKTMLAIKTASTYNWVDEDAQLQIKNLQSYCKSDDIHQEKSFSQYLDALLEGSSKEKVNRNISVSHIPKDTTEYLAFLTASMIERIIEMRIERKGHSDARRNDFHEHRMEAGNTDSPMDHQPSFPATRSSSSANNSLPGLGPALHQQLENHEVTLKQPALPSSCELVFKGIVQYNDRNLTEPLTDMMDSTSQPMEYNNATESSCLPILNCSGLKEPILKMEEDSTISCMHTAPIAKPDSPTRTQQSYQAMASTALGSIAPVQNNIQHPQFLATAAIPITQSNRPLRQPDLNGIYSHNIDTGYNTISPSLQGDMSKISLQRHSLAPPCAYQGRDTTNIYNFLFDKPFLHRFMSTVLAFQTESMKFHLTKNDFTVSHVFLIPVHEFYPALKFYEERLIDNLDKANSFAFSQIAHRLIAYLIHNRSVDQKTGLNECLVNLALSSYGDFGTRTSLNEFITDHIEGGSPDILSSRIYSSFSFKDQKNDGKLLSVKNTLSTLHQAYLIFLYLTEVKLLNDFVKSQLALFLQTARSKKCRTAEDNILFLLLIDAITESIPDQAGQPCDYSPPYIEWQSHINQQLNNTMPVFSSCPYCMQAFFSPTSQAEHTKEHTTDIFCPSCYYAQGDKTNYCICNPTVAPHSNRRSRFLCLICYKTFSDKYKLTLHSCLHRPHSSNSKYNQCAYCDKNFFQARRLNNHIRQIHPPPTDMESHPINEAEPTFTGLYLQLKESSVFHKLFPNNLPENRLNIFNGTVLPACHPHTGNSMLNYN